MNQQRKSKKETSCLFAFQVKEHCNFTLRWYYVSNYSPIFMSAIIKLNRKRDFIIIRKLNKVVHWKFTKALYQETCINVSVIAFSISVR